MWALGHHRDCHFRRSWTQFWLAICVLCVVLDVRSPHQDPFVGSLSVQVRRDRQGQQYDRQAHELLQTPALAAQAADNGPVGDWVECTISYTPTVSMMKGIVEPPRSDTYLFHKMNLQEQFGHLYAKLGFTIQENVIYKDVSTVCREPDNLEGQCSDCFKFIFGGTIGFVGLVSPKYYGRTDVTIEECIGDSAELKAQEDALPFDKFRPETSYWCMKNS